MSRPNLFALIDVLLIFSCDRLFCVLDVGESVLAAIVSFSFPSQGRPRSQGCPYPCSALSSSHTSTPTMTTLSCSRLVALSSASFYQHILCPSGHVQTISVSPHLWTMSLWCLHSLTHHTKPLKLFAHCFFTPFCPGLLSLSTSSSLFISTHCSFTLPPGSLPFTHIIWFYEPSSFTSPLQSKTSPLTITMSCANIIGQWNSWLPLSTLVKGDQILKN